MSIHLRVHLHTPPTNKPRMPEGQTSRRCCSLLGVPVAGTKWAGRQRAALHPRMSRSQHRYLSHLKALVLHAVENHFAHAEDKCINGNTKPVSRISRARSDNKPMWDRRWMLLDNNPCFSSRRFSYAKIGNHTIIEKTIWGCFFSLFLEGAYIKSGRKWKE